MVDALADVEAHSTFWYYHTPSSRRGVPGSLIAIGPTGRLAGLRPQRLNDLTLKKYALPSFKPVIGDVVNLTGFLLAIRHTLDPASALRSQVRQNLA